MGEQCLQAHATILTLFMREQCWALSMGCKCGRPCLEVRILQCRDAHHFFAVCICVLESSFTVPPWCCSCPCNTDLNHTCKLRPRAA